MPFRHLRPLPTDSLTSLANALNLRLREIEERARFLFVIKGSPEGVVGAPVGSIAQRMDGGLLTTLYVKETGSGLTGWVAK